jgi:TatD DNase family protein
LGETGLDFYWDKTDPEIQKYNFRLHIDVAKEMKLPLVIHSRNAAEDCIKILIEAGASEVGGVFHCYSEDASFAQRLMDINFKVSFPGVITFKKADAMRAAARDIPIEQIMIETDCPFLAPQRVRGKRCEPSHVVDVAMTLAEIKGLSLEQVAEVTTENARKFFRLG